MTEFTMWGNIIPDEEIDMYYSANRISGDYIVGQTYIGELLVETVYLFSNHSWSDRNYPVMFETIVFNLKEDFNPIHRHSLYIDALIGHAMIVGHYRTGKELPRGAS